MKGSGSEGGVQRVIFECNALGEPLASQKLEIICPICCVCVLLVFSVSLFLHVCVECSHSVFSTCIPVTPIYIYNSGFVWLSIIFFHPSPIILEQSMPISIHSAVKNK